MKSAGDAYSVQGRRRSPQGERGLKYQWATAAGEIRVGRSPQGERGLKSGDVFVFVRRVGRSPQGERGLKLLIIIRMIRIISRSPQGERGLKLHGPGVLRGPSQSLPARGAWIEITI